ncbi:hypothetical protein DERP_009852 [Dermatophagoides pteronyssinus]|uniref:Transmembrane protein n=1 Tax=Dermatophagoides pteronyssinus TaxID=6956 RepID=A0ABQ8IRD1_DERPT|nr:hypothetical protein DERP_009852 [Dermatophagoides pteronyssinus]
MILEQKSDQVSATHMFRNYEWSEQLECQKQLDKILENTITIATIGNELFRLQTDHKIAVYTNLQKRFDSHKYRLQLIDPIGFNEYDYYQYDYNRILYHPISSIRATITADYPSELGVELAMFQQYPIIIHFFIIHHDQNDDHVDYQRLLYYEWKQKIHIENFGKHTDKNRKMINLINISIKGIYYRFIQFNENPNIIEVYEFNDLKNEYAKLCVSLELEQIYLEANMEKYCFSKTNDNQINQTSSSLSTMAEIFLKLEFGFNIEKNLYLMSIKNRLLFVTNINLLIDLTEKFSFKKLNFNEFFYCGHEHQQQHETETTTTKSKSNRSKIHVPDYNRIYYRKPKMQKPNSLHAFIEIIIGIKLLFIATYIIFTNYILTTFEMNQWNYHNLIGLKSSTPTPAPPLQMVGSNDMNQIKLQQQQQQLLMELLQAKQILIKEQQQRFFKLQLQQQKQKQQKQKQ